MTPPLKLEISLDLDKHLFESGRYRDDGEPAIGPTTLEDVVIGEAARLLFVEAKRGSDSIYDSLRRRVGVVRDEEIRVAVAPLIQEALNGEIQKTNSYGEATGQGTTTLREMIFDEAKKALTATSVRADLSRQNESLLQRVIREEIDRALKKELKEAIGEARAEVIGVVRKTAAEVIADTIVGAKK